MQGFLGWVFNRLIQQGQLTVEWPNGGTTRYGNGDGPSAAVRLRDANTVRRITLNPGLAVGEAYMDGGVEPIGCSIRDVLAVLMLNMAEGGGHPMQTLRSRARKAFRRVSQYNPARRARRNVAHHYDLDSGFFKLLLDRDMQYSCAYFPHGDESLDAAQVAKKQHIAAKLRLDRPGLTVLDIGCGWGGLALTLARDYGARVTGITLSTEQLAVARARAAAEGLSDQVSFELQDYRALNRPFDRIVSVGMFEHVGVDHYAAFFAMVRRCLAPDGVALLHSIGNSGPPSATNAWLAKYIFPGGYSPSVSEVLPHVERAGLIVADIEVLRLHYAKTLDHWQQRFAANRAQIGRMYDERFCRMFEFYLAGCELAFRYSGEMVFQMQLLGSLAAAPITRDYMMATERERAPALAAAQ